MAKGRGSVRPCLAIGVAVVLCLFALTKPALGAVYKVGGDGGWTFNVDKDNWSNGISFKAGDKLAFNYDKTIHNVVQVDKNGYDSCNSPNRAPIFQTGKDRVSLKRGNNYFICTIPGHCQGGMKIYVNAA